MFIWLSPAPPILRMPVGKPARRYVYFILRKHCIYIEGRCIASSVGLLHPYDSCSENSFP